MHCRSCDKLLNDFESTRRNAVTFEFLDLCNRCYGDIKDTVPAIERKDLITSNDLEDYYDELDDYLENIKTVQVIPLPDDKFRGEQLVYLPYNEMMDFLEKFQYIQIIQTQNGFVGINIIPKKSVKEDPLSIN